MKRKSRPLPPLRGRGVDGERQGESGWVVQGRRGVEVVNFVDCVGYRHPGNPGHGLGIGTSGSGA